MLRILKVVVCVAALVWAVPAARGQESEGGRTVLPPIFAPAARYPVAVAPLDVNPAVRDGEKAGAELLCVRWQPPKGSPQS